MNHSYLFIGSQLIQQTVECNKVHKTALPCCRKLYFLSHTNRHTCVGIWVCRQQTGILRGCVPVAPFPPVPPSPSTPPGLPRTAPRPPLGQLWTGDGCSCRSPKGRERRLVHCWRDSPSFGPKGQPRLQSHAAEPEGAWAGQGDGDGGESMAVDEWKKLRSTDSCCWISGHAAWRTAASQLQ